MVCNIRRKFADVKKYVTITITSAYHSTTNARAITTVNVSIYISDITRYSQKCIHVEENYKLVSNSYH